MARKTVTITIDTPGRDMGRVYSIKEMSASQAEEWATRALLALGQSGVDIPDNIAQAGFAGVVAIGVRAFAGLPWDLAKPLLGEMMGCVSFLPDPARPLVGARCPPWDDDIEEVQTRLQLRDEVISLHTGFSIAAKISKFKAALNQTTDENTSITSTSPEPSEQSSQRAARRSKS
jgi:hypothetical protein